MNKKRTLTKIFSIIIAVIISMTPASAVSISGTIGSTWTAYTGTSAASTSTAVTSTGYDFYSVTIDYDTIMSRIRWSEETSIQYLYDLSYIISNGGTATVPDIQTWSAYYTTKYAIYQPNTTLRYSYYRTDAGATITSTSTVESLVNRINTVNYVLCTFGIEQTSDAVTAIQNAATRVRLKMTYDLKYTSADEITAVTTGRGVCSHYAIAATILLNAEGIPTRTIYGTLNGYNHLWNECYVNGQWITVDFTNSSTGIVYDTSGYSKIF